MSFRRVIRVASIVLLMLAVFGGLHAYLAHRIVDGAGIDGPLAWAGYALFALLFFSIPAGFAAGRARPSLVSRLVLWTSHVWMGLFGLLLSAVLGAELIGLGAWAVTGQGAWTPAYSVGALAVAVGAALFGYYVAARPRVVRTTVPMKDLGDGLDGVRIVQISDLHIGQTLDGRFLQKVVDQVNALDPDLVAVTGDLVEGLLHTTREQVAPLAGLRGKLGVFYVTGNHEYYYGGPGWEAEVRRLGLTVLRNAHRVVERDGARIVVGGIPDYDAAQFVEDHRPDVRAAFAGAPRDVPRVLLAHQPRAAKLVGSERVDLQLSGHTHGGQIFPFMFFVKLQQPVVRGLKEVLGVRVYTHRGTGYWGPPIRVGASPEIAELTLVKA